MSKLENNRNNKKLDEFLNQKPGDPGLDDFEKEALEGFHSLQPGEAIDLKNQTDKAVHERLFPAQKKRPVYVWWAAAALFILLFGLGSYLVRNYSNNQPDLAENLPFEDRNEKILPAPSEPVTSPETNTAGNSDKQTETVKKLRVEEKNTGNKEKTEDLSPIATQAMASEADTEIQAPPTDISENAPVPPAEAPKETRSASPELAAGSSRAEPVVNADLKRAKKNAVMESAPETTAMDQKSAEPNSVVYKGGEKALLRELKNRLTPHSIPAFSATLHVSVANKVTLVLFDEKSTLSEDEKKLVRETFLKLDKFEAKINDAGQPALYQFSYTP